MSLPAKPRRSLAEGEFLFEVDPEPLEETVTAYGGHHLNLPDGVFKIATPFNDRKDSILSPLTELGVQIAATVAASSFRSSATRDERFRWEIHF